MLTLARRNFERVSELRKENISSEKEFLQAKQELEAAEIRAEGALGKLTRLGTDAADARPSPAPRRRPRRAPRPDGRHGPRHARRSGRGGQDRRVARHRRRQLDGLGLGRPLRAGHRRGQHADRPPQKLAASVSVKAYPGEEFPGTVDFVSPAMDEASRTVKVRVEVKNPDGRLLAGMFADVKLFLPGDEEALAVPQDAVLEDEGRSFVFVHHHGDYYVRRPVIVGRTWAGWVEVKKGLEPATDGGRRGRLPHEVRRPALEDGRGLRGLRGRPP